MVIAVDFSGHVDGGNRADDEALGGGQSVFLTDCHEDYGFWMKIVGGQHLFQDEEGTQGEVLYKKERKYTQDEYVLQSRGSQPSVWGPVPVRQSFGTGHSGEKMYFSFQ